MTLTGRPTCRTCSRCHAQRTLSRTLEHKPRASHEEACSTTAPCAWAANTALWWQGLFGDILPPDEMRKQTREAIDRMRARATEKGRKSESPRNHRCQQCGNAGKTTAHSDSPLVFLTGPRTQTPSASSAATNRALIYAPPFLCVQSRHR